MWITPVPVTSPPLVFPLIFTLQIFRVFTYIHHREWNASLCQPIPLCGLWRQLDFLLIRSHQLQSITPSHWWRQWPVVTFIVPRSAKIKLNIRNRNKTIGFPIQTTNIFFTMNFNTEIDFFRSDHDHHHQQFYRGEKPPRQEQTYISYLMFLIWGK